MKKKFRLASGGYEYVAPENIEAFKENNPDAVEITFGVSISPDAKPKSENTFWNTVKNLGMVTSSLISPAALASNIAAGEVKKAKGEEEPVLNTIARIGGEYAESLYVGYKTGTVMEEYLEVQKGNHSPEAIEAMIKAGDMLNKLPQNDRMIKFAKAVEESGGGFWNGLIQLGKQEDGGVLLASQVALQSLAMMATAATHETIEELAEGNQPDVLKHMIGGAGVGAALYGGTGAAIGSIVPLAGTAAGTVLGGKFGALAGGLGGLSLAMEKGLTFVELLKEEIEASGEEYNKESIRRFLQDDEKYLDIRDKAVKRGLAIGIIDMLSGGLAGAATVKTGKVLAKTAMVGSKGTRIAAIGAGTTVEGISGGTGEFFGQKAAGQKYNAADIILEAFAETPGALVTSVPLAIAQSKATYSLIENDVKMDYTKKEFLDKIEGLSDLSIAMLDINVTNDDILASELYNRQQNAIIKSRIDPRVSDEVDINELVRLEKRRQEAEADTKKKGVYAVPRAKEKLEKIEAQIEDVVNKYEGVDRRTKDVRARKKAAKDIRDTRKKILMDKITKGVKESKAYKEMDIETTEVSNEQARELFERSTNIDINLLEEELNEYDVNSDEYRGIQRLINLKRSELSDIDQSIGEVGRSHGFLLEDAYTGKLNIVVNRDAALADNTGNINVAAHEFLHAVLRKTFGVKGKALTAGKSLFQFLNEKDHQALYNSNFIRRLKAYQDLDIETQAEEVLTLLSDALVKGELTFNENFWTKAGDFIKTAMQAYLPGRFGKIKFKDGRDVYRFVKNYNKSIEKEGKGMEARVVEKAAKEGIEVTKDKAAKETKKTTPMSKPPIDFDSTLNNEVEAATNVKDFSSLPREEQAEIWEGISEQERLVIGMQLGPLWRKWIGDRADSKYETFESNWKKHRKEFLDKITVGIQPEDNGLPFVVKTWKPKEAKLTTHIINNLPKRMPHTARTISGFGEVTTDTAGAKDITTRPQDAILTPRVLEQYKTPLLSGLTFVKEQIKVLRDTVALVVGTRLKALDAAVSKNKSISPLIADMKAQLYVKNGPIHKMVYDIMSEKAEVLTQEYLKKTNPKTKKPYTQSQAKNQAFKDSVEAFFKNPKYKKAVLESLTTTWLAKHLKKGVQKEVNGIGWTTDWVGRTKGTKKGQVNFWRSSEEGPYKGMTDGKPKIRRNPKIMDEITPAMLGSAFIKGETITDIKRGGLENISLAITQELGIETFKADMVNDGALKKLFTGRQELFGRILDNNFVEEFVRQAERGTTKFSQPQPVNTKLTKDVNQELAKKINKQASYNSIVEIAGFKPINIETVAGRDQYLGFFIEKIVPKLPKKVLLAMSGTFARGDSIIEKAYKSKFIFRNKEEFSMFLDGIEAAGIRFGVNVTEKNATDMLNAVTRIGYGTVSKKTQQKKVAAKEMKASKKRGFKLLWKMIQNEVRADKNTIPGFAVMLSSSSQFQGHVMRAGAAVNFYNLLMGKNVEEHTSPITALGKFLFINAVAGNLFTGKINTFDKVIKSYFQGSLPAFMDHRLKLKGPDGKMVYNYSDMPPPELLAGIFNGDISVWARYFHPNVNNNFSIDESVMSKEDIKKYKDIGGIDPNIIVLEGGQTVAELFGVDIDSKLLTPQVIAAQQDLIYRQAIGEKISPTKIKNTLTSVAGVKFSRSTKSAQLMTQAVNFSRSAKNKTQGMSAWDFDDTVAKTKSGVIYTMPNPSGIAQPGRKVIFLAGGAGSGKSNVVKQLGLVNQGFKVVNSDISLEWLKKNSGLPANSKDFTSKQLSKLGKLQWEARKIAARKQMKFQGQGDGIVVDGTGGSMNVMNKQVQEFKNKGYDVQMVFVETSLETAIERNAARKERTLKESIVRKNHEAVQNNKEGFRALFGDNFAEVKTDNIKMNDPMPASLTTKLDKFTKGYIKSRLTAEEFAIEGSSILEQGGKFDFAEFDVVTEGEKGPLFGKAMARAKKFGNKDQFILTARPHASKQHIHDFLKSQGLNIPLENVITLENSTSEAKALWIAEKVGQGYNSIYFADDALQNVQAVDNMLAQFDVKRDVQQAKTKFSKSINQEFNDILEDVTGIESKKRFSDVKARKRGANKGKFRFFIPPSHEDFVGLIYNFLGKGRKGDQHRNFFEKALIRPLNRAYTELNTARQSIANDYKSLNKEFKNVRKKLIKKTPDGDFTYQDAIRVYLFDKHGHEVPGLTKTDQQKLVDLVTTDPELQNYADILNIISKQDKYVNPTTGWEAGDIRTDLDAATGRVGREQFFAEFFENADIVFSQENLNKIEAAYGDGVVSAIKDILYRTKTGRNRPSGQNKLVNTFLNYLNGSVAATMFFNIRSMVLQQMSMVNFINFADNNIFTAAKAFANQPQYYRDWAYIFNSDFMKQRRGGIKTDVNGAELAAELRGAKNTPRALIAKLLQLGFLPTQIGDNIAIATGGATFYRNRINTYLKQGLDQKAAEEKAWTDFQVLAEATQQSARPDMVSQQQASPLGKVILAFQNVTSQFNRLGKKAFLDLKNRRITPGNTTQFQSDVSNVSRIGYYFAIQNLIFYSLQSALFLMMFEDDEDDKKWLKKKERVVNGSVDSVLRGTGVWGAVIATLKNMAIKWHEQRDKKYNPDESSVLMEALNVSPPLGIKARKMVNAEKTLNYNKRVIEEMDTFDIDNPMWSAITSYIEATTNIPLNRLYNKTQNVRQSLNSKIEAYKRALMFSGWSQYNLGIENEKMEKIKEETKKKKKKSKNGKGKIPRYKTITP